MPEITIVRHAQTEYNKAGIFAGRTDCNITKEGKELAKEVFKKGETFDVIYCSQLKRTHQTLEAMLPGSKYIIDKRIVEIDLGDWEGKEKNSFPEDLIKKYRSGEYRPPNAESIEKVDKRVCEFFEYLFEKYQGDEKILVVTHNGVMRAIKRNFKNDFSTDGSKNLDKIILTSKDFEEYKTKK